MSDPDIAPPIAFADFLKVDIRAGRITRAEEFAKARKPSYKLWIDFGPFGEKRSSAQITRRYKAEELVGSMVLAVVNFPPRQVADFMSDVLVLGVVVEEGDVVLVRPEMEVPLGKRLL